MKFYGMMEDFYDLFMECCSCGLKFVMDFVLNYIFIEYFWFKEVEMNLNSKYCKYYFWWLGIVDGLLIDWVLDYG